MELEKIRNLENVKRHRQEICEALAIPFTDDMITDDYYLRKFDGQEKDYLDSLGLINRGYCPLCGYEPIGRKYHMRLGVDSKGVEYLCKECDERTGGGRPFLRTYGYYIVYLAFLFGLGVDGGLAIYYFGDGQWLMAVWAFFAILILPKATLGLILLAVGMRFKAGGKPITVYDMPLILRNIFPRTMRRYRYDSSIFIFRGRVLRSVIRELIWLGISLFPVIGFVIGR